MFLFFIFYRVEENLPSSNMQPAKRLARSSPPRSSNTIQKLSSSPSVNTILWLTKSTVKVSSNSTKHFWFASTWSWSWICKSFKYNFFIYYLRVDNIKLANRQQINFPYKGSSYLTLHCGYTSSYVRQL